MTCPFCSAGDIVACAQLLMELACACAGLRHRKSLRSPLSFNVIRIWISHHVVLPGIAIWITHASVGLPIGASSMLFVLALCFCT